MATQQPAQSGYNPQQFNDALRDYLRKLYASQGKSAEEADAALDSASSGGGGGGSGGSTGQGIAALLATLAAKWGAQKVLGPIIQKQVVGPVKDYILQQLGFKAAETGAAAAGAETGAASAAAGAEAAAGGIAPGAAAATEGAAIGAISAGALPAGATALGAGAYAIPAGAAVPAGFTAVGTAANGGLVVASNTSILGGTAAAGSAGAGAAAGGAAATGTGAATTTAAGSGATVSGTMAAAAPYLAAIIAAYMGYQSVKARNKLKGGYGTNLTDDELRQTSVPGFTSKYAPPGAEQGFMRHINPLTGGPAAMVDKLVWGSTKSGAQLYRDRVRKYMTKQGILDPEYNLDLGNGQKFNFGADGGARLANADGKGERRYNEIDTTNKGINTAELTSLLMPVGWSAAMASGDFKEGTRDSITSYMVNAAMQGAKNDEDAFRNARALAAKFGMNTANATQYVDELKKQGMIDSDQDYEIFKTKAAYLAAPEDPKANGDAAFQANLKAYLSQAGFGGAQAAPAAAPAPTRPIPRTGRGPSNGKK